MSDWRARAACLDEDPELFFPVIEEGPLVDAAKAVCGRCPVRDQCLAYATTNIHFGVAGGLTADERRRRRAGTFLPRIGSLVPEAQWADTRANCLALIEQGETPRDAAARCGVSQRTVERWRASLR
jgi:adenine-specific DNA glycosylase